MCGKRPGRMMLLWRVWCVVRDQVGWCYCDECDVWCAGLPTANRCAGRGEAGHISHRTQSVQHPRPRYTAQPSSEWCTAAGEWGPTWARWRAGRGGSSCCEKLSHCIITLLAWMSLTATRERRWEAIQFTLHIQTFEKLVFVWSWLVQHPASIRLQT